MESETEKMCLYRASQYLKRWPNDWDDQNNGKPAWKMQTRGQGLGGKEEREKWRGKTGRVKRSVKMEWVGIILDNTKKGQVKPRKTGRCIGH
jgi:hypothetical protein